MPRRSRPPRGLGAPKSNNPLQRPRGARLWALLRAALTLLAFAVAALSYKDRSLTGLALGAGALFFAGVGHVLSRRRTALLVSLLSGTSELACLVAMLALLVARSTMWPTATRRAHLARFEDFPDACVHAESCTRLAAVRPQRVPGLEVPLLKATAPEVYEAAVSFLAQSRRNVHYRVEKPGEYFHAEVLSPLMGLPDSLALRVACDEEFGLAEVWIHAEGTVDARDMGKNYRRVRALVQYLKRLERDGRFQGKCRSAGATKEDDASGAASAEAVAAGDHADETMDVVEEDL